MKTGSILLLIWLVIGFVAAAQRHYFDTGPITCATFGNISLTILAGPLNYMGVNPHLGNCQLPEPSP